MAMVLMLAMCGSTNGQVLPGGNWVQISMAEPLGISQAGQYHSMAIAWPLELIRTMTVVQMLVKYGFMNGRAVPGRNSERLSTAKPPGIIRAIRYHSMAIAWPLGLI